MSETEQLQDITTFSTTQTRWLSNFYPYKNRAGDKHPETVRVELSGIIFDCTENAYQAAKSLDPAVREKISKMTPFESKEYWIGKEDQIRPDWNQVKDDVMMFVCFQKFYNTPTLRAKLVATGSVRLIEGNTWGDRYWGVSDGIGLNKLGKTLERIRHIFQSNKASELEKIAHSHQLHARNLCSERGRQ